MDFFQRQEVARRKTGLLLVYSVAAVAFMIAGLYFVSVGVLAFIERKAAPEAGIDLWQPEWLLVVAVGTIFVIAAGSFYKIIELRAGGSVVAEQLGGRLLMPNTPDRDERRLLNVVEEMALASGVPVPPVYLLDRELGVNAFAAGYTPSDAVVGVTRGAVELLSRDELQGVIAHEFSHILNGDMRLNLRLIGVLHGILLLALIGYYMLRFGGGSKKGGQLVLFGLAMVVLGYVGLFFARLIKAAVSRQREYLADASAVQFTRNPGGIGGALKTIGGLSSGSRIESPAAETAAHMFFGGVRTSWLQALSTHPPLVERIRRIEPSFDGKFPRVALKASRAAQPPAASGGQPRSPFEALGRPLEALEAVQIGGRIPIEPAVVMAAIGSPQTQHLVYAHDLMARLPPALVAAVRDPFSARAAIAALMLDRDPAIRQKQLEIVAGSLGPPVAHEAARMGPAIEAQGVAARLPFIEIAIGALHDQSPAQYQTFRDTVVQLARANDHIDLFEFALQRMLFRPLDRHFGRQGPPAVLYPSINGLARELSDLISALAHLGHGEAAAAALALEQARAVLGIPLEMRARSECTLDRLDQALEKLSAASGAVKRRVLHAAVVCVMADGQVTLGEAELLRAVAASLDCPLPPLLAGVRS